MGMSSGQEIFLKTEAPRREKAVSRFPDTGLRTAPSSVRSARWWYRRT